MTKIVLTLCFIAGIGFSAPIQGPATHPTAQSNGQGNAPDWLFLSCTPSGADALLMTQMGAGTASIGVLGYPGAVTIGRVDLGSATQWGIWNGGSTMVTTDPTMVTAGVGKLQAGSLGA